MQSARKVVKTFTDENELSALVFSRKAEARGKKALKEFMAYVFLNKQNL